MTVVSMNYLLEAGVQFGHQKRRWNPKMKEYIFTTRDDIYIIDLQKTVKKIEEAYEAMKEIAQNEGKVLFVGTKKQAQEAAEESAVRTNMYFVNERWLGGTLTNFKTIRSRIRRMEEIEKMETDGTFEALPKKEVIQIRKEYDKLNKNLRGIREMKRMPQAMVIVDPRKEEIAIKEARILGIPDAIAEVNGNEVIDYISEDDKTKVEKIKEKKEEIASEVKEKTEEVVEKVKEVKEEIKKVAKKEVKKAVEKVSEIKEEVEEKKTAKKSSKKANVDLATLSLAELKEKAKECGIKGYSTKKKAELIESLNK